MVKQNDVLKVLSKTKALTTRQIADKLFKKGLITERDFLNLSGIYHALERLEENGYAIVDYGHPTQALKL